jgi:nitrogen fixation/metabolism regulation signal transduction histidine kinase
LVLLAAVLIGLVLANQLAGPISRLIVAAERVRGGDLSVRVEEGDADDEVGSLSRAFNRMTNQLAGQRSSCWRPTARSRSGKTSWRPCWAAFRPGWSASMPSCG